MLMELGRWPDGSCKSRGLIYSCMGLLPDIAAMEHYLIPPFLKGGARIGIMAPARPVSWDELAPALDFIARNDWEAVVGNTIGSKHFVLSAPAEQRRYELQQMLDNPDVNAIWMARGGYGSVQFVDQLDWTAFRHHPKWLIGFSDATTLLSASLAHGVAALHATMPQQLTLKGQHEETLQSLAQLLRGEKMEYQWKGSHFGPGDPISGPLVGGNLSLLYNQMGSPTQPDARGAIVFLEEIGEYCYHFDRMLWGLRRSGFFDGALAILTGGLAQMLDNDDDPWGNSSFEILKQHSFEMEIPLVLDFPAGHQQPNIALPLGLSCQLQVSGAGDSLILKAKA